MMIRRGWRTGALVLATVWLTGCAGTGAPLTQSGFLQDYARLQPRDDATVAWLNPSTRPFGERPLVVAPVVIREQQVAGAAISLADHRSSHLRPLARDDHDVPFERQPRLIGGFELMAQTDARRVELESLG
mgnify:CR=1 FL=1